MLEYVKKGTKSGIYGGLWSGIVLSGMYSVLILLITLVTKNASFGMGYLPLIILIPAVPIILVSSISIWTVIGMTVGAVIYKLQIMDKLPRYSNILIIVVCVAFILIHYYLISARGPDYILWVFPISLLGIYCGVAIKLGQRRLSQYLH